MTKAQAEQHAAQKLLQLIPQQPSELLTVAAFPDKQTARSSLHEMQQKGVIKTITYVYERSGQEHEGMFTCICTVLDAAGQSLTATGQGTTKRQASQAASFQMLAQLAGGDVVLDEVK